MKHAEHKRSTFSGKIGFVLSAAGASVGLGNIWRFPYLAAKYGGGIFLLIYIILAVTFGFALMITEIAIGRKTRLSCIGAYKALDKRFGFLGWLAALVPVIITPYYCVIGGWVMKYLATFVSGGMQAAAGDNFFTDFITVSAPGIAGNPLLWFVLYVLLNAVVVLCGVEKGIEKASRFLMPVLVILAIIVAGYSLTIPGAIDGLKFYLLPNFSHFSPMTVLGAMGQLFYSMSLAMGIMITYGSYMQKENILEHSVGQIEIFDTAIAMIAGLMIIPAVVAFNGGDTTLVQSTAGPGLMFGVLPKVFDHMAGGAVVGIVFFVLVLFAALTSSISLMETLVSFLMDKTRFGRRPATIIVTVCVLIFGVPSCLGYGPWSSITLLGMAFLDFFDFLTNSVMMPIAAIATCLLVSRVIGVEKIAEEVTQDGQRFRRKPVFDFMIRYLCPVFAAIILASSVANALGWISM